MEAVQQIESIHEVEQESTPEQEESKSPRNRVIISAILFVVTYALELLGVFDSAFGHPTSIYVEFAAFITIYCIVGYDVLIRAAKNVSHGNGLDENFLMTVASLGAFALIFFPDTDPHMAEGCAVMIFYQIGELFEDYAVDSSRRSIKGMLDVTPQFANVLEDGQVTEKDPHDVAVGETVVVRVGEHIPLDGTVLTGDSQLDTSVLTGEPTPRGIHPGDTVLSGCLNLNSTITIRVEKPFSDSTVARILEMVERASERKARTENFITRFARYYTPIVVGLAAALAIIPPLFVGGWSDWIFRGLTFLVVSCPCALVISVPLSFFAGIGRASKYGILVKGSNYVETLAEAKTVVFDKTGTLTSGTFEVTGISPAEGHTKEGVLRLAALAEALSTHPIAQSIQRAWEEQNEGRHIEIDSVSKHSEIAGYGIAATIDDAEVLVGNERLMEENGIATDALPDPRNSAYTYIYVAQAGKLVGAISIGDSLKKDTKEAISAIHAQGVERTIMLTGDVDSVAESVADTLGIDEVYAELLPQDKVTAIEKILDAENEDATSPDRSGTESKRAKVAYVGDGINDAPTLMRSDVGIAMGAMGSDAAIEAADIVLMDDNPLLIASAIKISKYTMRIVWQNIIFAIGIKVAILILAAIGLANMWMAVFGDVGVCILAILNSMRALRA